jgi:hypothetical protein
MLARSLPSKKKANHVGTILSMQEEDQKCWTRFCLASFGPKMLAHFMLSKVQANHVRGVASNI